MLYFCQVSFWGEIEWVEPIFHLASLVDGPDCDLDLCIRDLIAPTVITYPNPSTKVGKCPDDDGVGHLAKVGVNPEWHNVFTPLAPKTRPLVGSRCHMCIGNGVVSNTEVTGVINLGLITKSCQQFACGRG